MKTKVLLPVLAMFFAIGMSFAIDRGEIDPSQDYVWSNGSFMPLGTEIDCGIGNLTCEVRLQNGQVYKVYDAPDRSSLKEGDGETRELP